MTDVEVLKRLETALNDITKGRREIADLVLELHKEKKAQEHWAEQDIEDAKAVKEDGWRKITDSHGKPLMII